MQHLFEWAAGSVPGRDHRHAFRNNHDAWAVDAHAQALVGVVCDGCGSGDHSEVGAWITAETVLKQTFLRLMIEPMFFRPETAPIGLVKVQKSVLAQLSLLADMSCSNSKAVENYLLSTILGVVMTVEDTLIFGSADGAFWVNGLKVSLETPNNTPPYLAYHLTDSKEKPNLKLYYYLKTKEVKSILLGTDGVTALDQAVERNIPGKDEKIGPVSQFWEQDRFFANPFALGHRLNLINRDFMEIDYENRTVREEHGPLTDDTTLLVVRRRR